MSKKHKKKKLSRKARKGQPHASRPQATPAPAAEQPEPVQAPPADSPTGAGDPQPAITATFTPAEPQAASETPETTASEEAEYTSVRKDLRKLGVTILVLALVVGGLVVLNDQTGFMGTLGEQLFRLWE